jgi:hypothetical protein
LVPSWRIRDVVRVAVWRSRRGGRGEVRLAARPFSTRPDPTTSRAVAWAIVNGVASDLAAVASHIAARDDWAHSPDFALLVLQGVGESMSPAILGGGVLSVVSLLCAAGHARMRAEGAAP